MCLVCYGYSIAPTVADGAGVDSCSTVTWYVVCVVVSSIFFIPVHLSIKKVSLTIIQTEMSCPHTPVNICLPRISGPCSCMVWVIQCWVKYVYIVTKQMNVSTDSEWTTNDFDVVIPSLIILVDDHMKKSVNILSMSLSTFGLCWVEHIRLFCTGSLYVMPPTIEKSRLVHCRSCVVEYSLGHIYSTIPYRMNRREISIRRA